MLTAAGVFAAGPRGLEGEGAAGDPAWAAAVLYRGGSAVASAVVRGTFGAPYLPGLLALRVGPLLETALASLDRSPAVVLVDATGADHPRRAGLAIHLGAATGLPTIGVTDRPLVALAELPGPDRGARAPLMLGRDLVGAVLRTRAGARPLCVHPGWRTDLETAVEVVLALTRLSRTPQPLREARRLARTARARDGRRGGPLDPSV